jgi:hypothetical protein
MKPQFLGGTARSPVTMHVERTVTGELERLGTVSSLRVGLACQRLGQVRGETVQRK